MSYPMPEPLRLPFWGGERTILKRDAMLLRITTDTGLRGYAPGPAHERAALGDISYEDRRLCTVHRGLQDSAGTDRETLHDDELRRLLEAGGCSGIALDARVAAL